jgi:hypothetical protein
MLPFSINYDIHMIMRIHLAALIANIPPISVRLQSLEAVSERKRNGGRSSFDVISRGCDTNLGRHHVEPDLLSAA